MKRLNIILATLLAGIAAISCSVNEQPATGPGRAIKFSGSPNGFTVKATDTSFEEGDVIGLYAMAPVNAYDIRLTVQNGELIPDKEVYWGADQTEASDFYAFYPYVPDFVPTRDAIFTVKTDQSYYDSYTKSDFMYAYAYASPEDETVHFTFRHGLSKLIIRVDSQIEEGISAITFGSVATSAYFFMSDWRYHGYDNFATVSTCPVTLADGSDAWIMVVPSQSVENPVITVITESGRSIEFKYNGTVGFSISQAQTATLVVGEEAISATFSSEVLDWGIGGEYVFHNRWEKQEARLYVLDESFLKDDCLHIWHNNNNDNSYLYPSGAATFGDIVYNTYEIGDFCDQEIIAGFSNFEGNNYSWRFYLQSGISYFMYRSPARVYLFGGYDLSDLYGFDPAAPYEYIGLDPYYDASVYDLTWIPANDYQVYQVAGYVGEVSDNSFYLIDADGDASILVDGLSGAEGLVLQGGEYIEIRALKQYSEDGEPFLSEAELVQVIDVTAGNWSVIGDICGTSWDTDFPMEQLEIIADDEPLEIYGTTIKYQGGEEFKIRQNNSWDVNFGGPGEYTSNTYILDISNGYAEVDAIKNGCNLSVDVSAFKDYCGAIGIMYIPSTGDIIVADAEVYAEMLEGEWEPSEEPEELSVADVLEVEDGTFVEIEESIVVGKSTRGFVLFDEEENGIMVYQGAQPAVEVSIGDFVKVSGTKTTYNNCAEISDEGLTVELIENIMNTEMGQEYGFKDAEELVHSLLSDYYVDISQSIDNWSAYSAIPVQFYGIVASATSIAVPEQTRQVVAYWPLEKYSVVLSENVNHECYVTGFVVSYSRDKINIIIDSLTIGEEVESEIIDISIPDFLDEPESSIQKYRLTGSIAPHNGTINTTYGNFELVDETGASVYVYGLTATDLGYGARNDKSYSSLGLEEGDTITIVGYRGSYTSGGVKTDEVVYAYLESKAEATPGE